MCIIFLPAALRTISLDRALKGPSLTIHSHRWRHIGFTEIGLPTNSFHIENVRSPPMLRRLLPSSISRRVGLWSHLAQADITWKLFTVFQSLSLDSAITSPPGKSIILEQPTKQVPFRIISSWLRSTRAMHKATPVSSFSCFKLVQAEKAKTIKGDQIWQVNGTILGGRTIERTE